MHKFYKILGKQKSRQAAEDYDHNSMKPYNNESPLDSLSPVQDSD